MESFASTVAHWIVTLLTERWVELVVLVVLISVWRWFMGVNLKRDLRREIATLKAKQRDPGSVVINGGVHVVNNYYRDGEHRAEIEGKATVISPLPLRIGVSATAPSDATGASASARMLPASDKDAQS